MHRLRTITLAAMVFAVPCCVAQAKENAALAQTIAGLDNALFDAYNRCDTAAMERLVAKDLEFFHDQSGLSVGRELFVENNRKYICGKVQRDLVPGTLEVFPIKDYGAMETGVHRFRHPGNDTEPLGEARFLMIWQQTSAGWQLTRVVSYGHGTAK